MTSDRPLTSGTMPAEWAPHQATLLAWPDNPETWPEHLDAARRAFLDMIEALLPHENVILLARDCEASDSMESQLQARSLSGSNRLRIAHIPYNDSWLRDTGPLFVYTPDDEWVALDFRFNAWGGKYEPYDDDDQLARRISRMQGWPLSSHDSFILEGGSIDVNGDGTLLTTRQCLLNPNRNPDWSPEAIEGLLRKTLGISRILWLDEGIVGDDTDGHIDDIARFVGPTRVLTTLAHSRSDPNEAALRHNWSLLKTMGDQDGNLLEIIDIPTPDLDLRGPFGPCPASYANFYIANNVVLVPVFQAPNEESVLSVFRDLFPERSIIPIDCRGLVCGLGAIHCVTQQVPAGV